MQARKPWMPVLLLLLLMIMEINFGNDSESVALIYMTIAGGGGSEAWENACRMGEDLIARAGQGRAGLDRPSAELSNPFACVCNLWRGSSPAHTYSLPDIFMFIGAKANHKRILIRKSKLQLPTPLSCLPLLLPLSLSLWHARWKWCPSKVMQKLPTLKSPSGRGRWEVTVCLGGCMGGVGQKCLQASK